MEYIKYTQLQSAKPMTSMRETFISIDDIRSLVCRYGLSDGFLHYQLVTFIDMSHSQETDAEGNI